jgi:polysaccharide export outer membrane protein
MTAMLTPSIVTTASFLVAFALTLVSTSRPAAGQPLEYLVGPQDVLAVTVWDQLNLSGKFIVEADGTFTFPLVGRVQAGGKSLRAVESELTARLADGYFKKPQISVTVEEYRSRRIFVIGEVRQAGSYPISAETTLIEALARAGSTTPAAGRDVVVVRAPEGRNASGPVLPHQAAGAEVLRLDLDTLQRGTEAQSLVLRDGDTVFVPQAEHVYVFGQVRSPGAYPLRTETTVVQALSLAGGVTERGALGRTRIMRIVDGRKKEFKVQLNDVVQAGDTIIVPERFF